MDQSREDKPPVAPATPAASEDAGQPSSSQSRERPAPGNLDLTNLTRFPPSDADNDQRANTTSPSVVSERLLGQPSAASEISGDVVFPIRSVVSVDPTSTKSPTDESHPDFRAGRARRSRKNTNTEPPSQRPSHSETNKGDNASSVREPGPMSSIQADAARQGSGAPIDLNVTASDNGTEEESGALGKHGSGLAASDNASLVSEGRSSTDIPNIATRFTYVQTDEGHAVITGRDGILQQCEDEPIHTPGAVQGFGAMLALNEESDGRFVVRYVSENSERLIGYSPRHLFRLKNFLDILTEEQQENLLDHIDFIRDEDADPSMNGPEVLSLSIRHPKLHKSFKLWCAIHINAAHPDLILCEFELDDDELHPLRPPNEATPEPPTDTLDSNPTLEELEESTQILSKPLRILRSARKRRGEQGAMQVFDIMSQIQEQLASATSLEKFLKVLVGIVKELTGFHRIMIYQFDASFNGKVVTEVVDTAQTKDLYKGLQFPASDIPRQARELYKINKVRLLYDRDLETARIVCRTKEDLDTPLDMTHAYLRAMSPIHLKYLSHMQVRSSMSISVNAFNELWGLIACHSYGGNGMRVSFPIRKMCRLVGETASRNIERLSYASRLQARKLINTAPTDKNPSGYIIASSDDLLKLFDADFGLLSIKDETKILGQMQESQEALALLEYLRMRRLTSVTASQDVKIDFPDLRYQPGFQVIAGLLYVPLSVGGNDFIVFFRKGQIREVKWAGNPYEKIIRQGTAAYLEPRSSFKTWYELVLGQCREWSEEQVETAAVLCLVYGKFIEIWRQKEAALQNSNLTRLLLSNSAHEVRTPLNAIINYLEIALEGSLDEETRDNLVRSHSASKSLIYVINDLLDLTKAEEGQNLIKDEVFDLLSCVREATEPYQVDANRKGLKYEVLCQEGLPQYVHGDSRRVRQAISNVTANAMSHTQEGSITVEVLLADRSESSATLEFVVTDTGSGMDSQKVDALFRDLEQVSAMAPDLTDDSEAAETTDDMKALGLGLAIVGRIVRNMDGQLRLKSEVGIGSRFVIQLNFSLPDSSYEPETASGEPEPRPNAQPLQISTVSTQPSPTPSGEITLVARGSGSLAQADQRETSVGSGGSHRSASRRSGSQGSLDSKKSDADRLIDAIQTPLSMLDKEKEGEYFISRRHSRGSAKNSSLSLSGKSAHTMTVRGDESTIASPSKVESGTTEVKDSKTPIKAVKIAQEYGNMDAPSPPKKQPELVEISSPAPQRDRTKSTTSGGALAGDQPLKVLIAEDDPINLKILQKRLERAGHESQHALNGQDCAAVYKERSSEFDIVLMDMQMPIVDGLTSTKMIREFEKTPEHVGHSEHAKSNGRIPIFAVSASLVEKDKDLYVEAGFDGWILKPIDFKRLNVLLAGIYDEGTRNKNLYVAGEWERGGWFATRSDAANTG